jgi:hypothetical protein
MTRMEKVHEELLYHVVRCLPGRAEVPNISRLLCYVGPGGNITWTRYVGLDVLCERLYAAEAKNAAHPEKEKKARALIKKSLYPLFALRARVPGEVAWIIVILAHWGG